ncbi:MAG TPA: hypothetical protein VK046_02640 [Actinomycetaceae bacterium]|nr:hypothetical protein [Actinomycetaceae bacterium]
MSQPFTLYQASSPTTPPETLAAIAAQRPDLRQFVAANPATGPEVVQWLGTLGDQAVDAALARRPAAQPAPPTGPPVTGSGAQASHTSGAYAQVSHPQAPHTPSPYAQGAHAQNPYAPSPYAQGPQTQSPYAHNPYAPPGSTSGAPVPPGAGYPDAYAPEGAYGDPAAGYYAAQPPARNTGVIVAIVVGAVVVLGVLAFAAATVFGVLGGGSYGDDPELDRLYDACAAGDGWSCDELYWQSPINSEYEEFGDTCGFRFPPQEVYCEGNI